jgi:hypothetical protein
VVALAVEQGRSGGGDPAVQGQGGNGDREEAQGATLEFGLYCAEEGMQRHLSAPYSPQQNGVVERRNQTIVGMARSMLKARKVPSTFWGEAVSTAVFILNRSPTKESEGDDPLRSLARPEAGRVVPCARLGASDM